MRWPGVNEYHMDRDMQFGHAVPRKTAEVSGIQNDYLTGVGFDAPLWMREI